MEVEEEYTNNKDESEGGRRKKRRRRALTIKTKTEATKEGMEKLDEE